MGLERIFPRLGPKWRVAILLAVCKQTFYKGRFLASFCVTILLSLKCQDTGTFWAEKFLSKNDRKKPTIAPVSLTYLIVAIVTREFREAGKPRSAFSRRGGRGGGIAHTLTFRLGVVCSTLNNLGFLVPNAPCSSGFLSSLQQLSPCITRSQLNETLF